MAFKNNAYLKNNKYYVLKLCIYSKYNDIWVNMKRNQDETNHVLLVLETSRDAPVCAWVSHFNSLSWDFFFSWDKLLCFEENVAEDINLNILFELDFH